MEGFKNVEPKPNLPGLEDAGRFKNWKI